MRRTGVFLGSAAMALSLMVSWPALSQSSIDFGDDSSRWAKDGQCDDPRFEGAGASAVRVAADEGHDATDCRTAFEAGTITLVGAASTPPAVTPPANKPGSSEIDFGDDSGNWANDGECDDPRFGGTLDSHRLADASDCRAAYEAGEVTYDDSVTISGAVQPSSEIDFGDDSGNWANDGECDDPRFGGTLDSHLKADATDCRAAYEAGQVDYSEFAGVSVGDIDFGDDSGAWALDGDCDDPRFGGWLTDHRLADATDCRAAYEADPSIYIGDTDTTTPASGDINFGDDSGFWAEDGECDDPRFGGGLESHRGTDATDCRAAYEAGEVSYLREGDQDENISVDGIDFGTNQGTYANDGECDDPRFSGPGMGAALDSHLMADANDCRAAYEAGEVTFTQSQSQSGSIYIDGIDFGDDTGTYANDGECDDPRFIGPGMGASLESHLFADATDCSTAYRDGEVTLAADEQGPSGFRINFGDDTGAHPNDGECDDPRFQGRGAAMELYEENILGDATDCRAAYEAGTVTYVP